MFSRVILFTAFLATLGTACLAAPFHIPSGNSIAISIDAPSSAAMRRDIYLFGCDGRTSTRLINVLSGISRSIRTISAMSSGQIFQSRPASALPENSVATLPGIT
jgi:hypothetical protein